MFHQNLASKLIDGKFLLIKFRLLKAQESTFGGGDEVAWDRINRHQFASFELVCIIVSIAEILTGNQLLAN